MAFDINTALLLPSTVWGYFEWFTGMVRINMDHETFEKGRLNETEMQELDETYNHEFFHGCQICTTGYLHYYVSQFLKEIAPVWRKITEASVLAKRTMPLMLDEVFKEKQQLTDKMKELLSNLDTIGESHFVTARTIIESQAYFVQKQMSDRTLTHQKFIELLKKAPSEEYSEAFFMATNYLGNDAFQYFNAISYASLLFFEPQNVFEKLCFRLSRRNFVDDDFTQELRTAIDVLKKDYLYLGDSEDVTHKYILNKEINPFYKTSIQLLRGVCKERRIDFFSLMSDPASWLGEVITQFDLPIIFNNGMVYEHSVEKKWQVFDRSYSKTMHLILGTICLIINNQRQDFAPRYLHLRK
jgi:hypothetical protein